MLSEQLAVVDNVTSKIYLIVYVDPKEHSAYQRGRERLKELLAALRRSVEIPASVPAAQQQARSEFGETAYLKAVERAKRYIFDGDIMQVVLSQRMSQSFDASPLALYRALRALNPSPYMFYFDFGDFHVVGASPEILVRLKTVTSHYVRSQARVRAAKRRNRMLALAQELLADPKERAEHLMLMDLGRNDVGRVAQTGWCR